MSALILTHLGESVPQYCRDCVHQFRLWNPTTPVFLILERLHVGAKFWKHLETMYGVQLIFTDVLEPTTHHKEFQKTYDGDTAFRKGYWKHVRERFFFVEELMIQKNLTHVISMEYDVLVYADFTELLAKFIASHQTLRFVKDNKDKGHPAFLYIPNAGELQKFTELLTGLNGLPYEDMQALAMYSHLFEAHMLPVITEARRKTIPIRTSFVGHSEVEPAYLSEDSEHFGVLFDSLVVGQWIGGIDPRNSRGQESVGYLNESALYSMREMPFEWVCGGTNKLWQPMLDERPLVMIHMHSKALHSFLSDRETVPKADYAIQEVYASLLPNEG